MHSDAHLCVEFPCSSAFDRLRGGSNFLAAPVSLLVVFCSRIDDSDSLVTESATGAGDAELDMVGGKDATAQTGRPDDNSRATMTDVERAVDEAVAASVASAGCLLDVEGSATVSLCMLSSFRLFFIVVFVFWSRCLWLVGWLVGCCCRRRCLRR
jgi:hypothetical protein